MHGRKFVKPDELLSGILIGKGMKYSYLDGPTGCLYRSLLMSEWISVKDRFPSHQQKVVFYVKGRNECFCGFFEKYTEHSRILKDKENIFFENLDTWWFEDEEITHWMPLPEMPHE
jgi:hypothetical protein